jgi:trk system potassium uptake protein TrkA
MSPWLGAAASQPSDAYRVLAVNVPRSWVGQSLREIDCRRRYGITVLAVHPAGHDEPAYAVPDPDRPLAPGDRLVLAGTSEGLRQARAV